MSQLATVHLPGNTGVERAVTSDVLELNDHFLNIDTNIWIIEAMADTSQEGRALAAGDDRRTSERPTSSKNA
ncbi:MULTISPECIES: hypothetical protein [Mycolicibacterium]|uniref:hypothetical protein n=1 Tax=Mycolicibacterium TaxID=1866885 RepID=UPI0007EB53F9|nr:MULTISPECIES: hypothetical protein [Mycolicibacterium]MBN3454911.1 hypothetical protein [Mycobacterium sp. DSM 3803]OKH75807.1 hypothetical protein EB73_03820 [Mycobacterium sp. SWH-M3]NOP95298.1 hypothetical protein [Mycolicibacterium fortuitum]OBB20495.1 hypothetical protein A5763_25090 [Mycolicibacterium fortuitum]OBB40789.1 hypothetical protein A5754_19640 [Mycolicibacterium fortuitum]